MDSWKIFNETLLNTENVYIPLNIESISNSDKKIMQSYFGIRLKWVSVLTHVFENFQDICFKTYNLDAADFYPTQGLAFITSLKMTKFDLEFLTDFDIVLIVEKWIRGGIHQSVFSMQILIIDIWKIKIKTNIHHI